MTNHEAIQFLNNMIGEEHGRSIGADGFYRELCAYHVDALRMAIKALKQEPCKDAISRADLQNQFQEKCVGECSCCEWDSPHWCGLIDNAPPVNPQPKTGHWIVHPKGIYAHLVCDKCLTRAPYDCKTNYCPTCGIKMVEPQESEEV